MYKILFPPILLLFSIGKIFTQKLGTYPPKTTTREPFLMTAKALPIVPLCLLKCKDNHMLQMENEWSSDFVFPLNDLLRYGANRDQMSQKVQGICKLNAELDECLRGCPSSIENDILRIGLQPWQTICGNIRVLQTQFGCWMANIDSITMECHFESQKLRHGIERLTKNVSVELVDSICADLRHLSVCFIGQYGKHCGLVSERLVATLFASSRDAIAQMLRMKWADLPPKCEPEVAVARDQVVQFLAPLAFTNETSSSVKSHRISPWLLSHLIPILWLLIVEFFVYFL